MNKRRFNLLFLFVYLCSLTACQINEQEVTADFERAPFQNLASKKDGVLFTIKNQQGKLPKNDITVTVVNQSSLSFTYGEHFAIEKYMDGVWYSIPLQIKALEAGNSLLLPDESIVQTVSLDPYLENDLPPGKYRLVKFFGELMDSRQNRKKNKLILAVPFKVTNNRLFIQ
ncbi:immunoglobulin-like domain-containing protein [Domibacillus robiginosus]|uniref:immunoglobulin-like domain-containing protein n=1 Tax=Domibacillus robiginosus TaxID=1071054 RepID=UPI00067BF8D9|nr:immunoglobulin-like domain-containing protein [Domibacillus robiginosus]